MSNRESQSAIMPQWSWQWLPGAHLSPQLSNVHKALAFSQACSPQQSLRTTQDKKSSIPRRVEGRQSQKEQAGSMQARVASRAEGKLGSWWWYGHEADGADKTSCLIYRRALPFKEIHGRGAAALPWEYERGDCPKRTQVVPETYAT